MAISLSNHKHTAARTRSRLRRQARGRKKLAGTPERPRLVVTRSAKHITVQVVDDLAGATLAYASTMEQDVRAGDGDKTNSSPGRARNKPSNHCAGRAGCFRVPVVHRVQFSVHGLRVPRAPGFPCAL